MPRAQCKDAAAAMRVFGEMKRSRVRPDVVSYTSLLTALEGTAQVGVQEAGIDGSGKAGTVPWGGDACLGSCAWLGAGQHWLGLTARIQGLPARPASSRVARTPRLLTSPCLSRTPRRPPRWPETCGTPCSATACSLTAWPSPPF